MGLLRWYAKLRLEDVIEDLVEDEGTPLTDEALHQHVLYRLARREEVRHPRLLDLFVPNRYRCEGRMSRPHFYPPPSIEEVSVIAGRLRQEKRRREGNVVSLAQARTA